MMRTGFLLGFLAVLVACKPDLAKIDIFWKKCNDYHKPFYSKVSVNGPLKVQDLSPNFLQFQPVYRDVILSSRGTFSTASVPNGAELKMGQT